jgi:hypothetical protein
MKPYLAIPLALLLAACPDANRDAADDAAPDGGAGSDAGPAMNIVSCPPLAMPAATATVFVDAGATAAEAGTQDAPYRTIAKAFANAGSKGVVFVAAGNYKESIVVPDQDLAVHGGFAPGFASRTDGCATVVEAASAAQPVFAASELVRSFAIDGLSIQNGAHGLVVAGDGSVEMTFTITSSVFAGNGEVDSAGGGASFEAANVRISRSVFQDNRASKGAALAVNGQVTMTIEDCLFVRNLGSSDHGGAVYVSPRTGTIQRNTFRGNEIGRDLGYGWGGAVIVYKAAATPTKVDLAFNVFTDNLAGVGAAVFVDDGATVTMSHDLVYRNRSLRENGVARGAAIYVDGILPDTGSVLIADHLTVVDNRYDEDGNLAELTQGGAVYAESLSKATFTNSILWNNGSDALFGDPTTEIAVSFSDAPGQCGGGAKCTIGAGVFEQDVLFVDEAAADYHEKSTAGHFHDGTFVIDAVTSPTLDRADPAASSANEPAPNGNRADLGAYGNTAEASKSPL